MPAQFYNKLIKTHQLEIIKPVEEEIYETHVLAIGLDGELSFKPESEKKVNI